MRYKLRKMHSGYWMLRKPFHPMSQSNGYVLEHRYMLAEYLGRVLNRYECVHHINRTTTDNRIENLELVPWGEHSRNHNKGKTLSKETRCRIGAATKGVRRSIATEFKKGQVGTRKGVRLSDETKKKLSELGRESYKKRARDIYGRFV